MEYLVFMLILISIILSLCCVYLKFMINDINSRVNDLIDILNSEV